MDTRASRRAARNRAPLDVENPDLHSLTVTIGLASQLLTETAGPAEWAALTAVLVDDYTPTQLANMLTGACTLIAKTQT